ncbi:GldG family protein [Ruficoccus amylovorans]|uniref:GldG family protein n=1 Tax=Ruficoccus amylovorans TaxID=1804625 RepID=A0A842HHT1_9BACT|nr:GldG family protein [Ruficoccus amylovorans]MBC2596315.1 GldG family protein [Ruficoccus amylovorans]
MSRMEEFSYARWVLRINRLVQIILFVTLVGAVNYIASRSFERYDLTSNNRYSLSAETLAYLDQVREPVRIIVTSPPESAPQEMRFIFRQVSRLLREYELASKTHGGRPMINVEYVNVYRQSEKAQELVNKFGISPDQDNVIVVSSGDRYKQVLPLDVWKTDQNGVSAFQGEQAFTSAILDVTNQNAKTIYHLTGHGEMRPDDVDPLRGFSRASYYLRQRNFSQKPLDLMEVPKVPEDAGLVIIAGIQTQLLPPEQEKLRRYLTEDNGRLVVLLEPGNPHGLDDLFYDWGVMSDDMLVLEASNEFLASEGDSLVGNFSEHPITKILHDNQLKVLVGLSRPVRQDLGAPIDNSLEITPLMASSPQSWAERDYLRKPIQYDEDTDLSGPVTLAMVSERSAGNRFGLNIPGGKLVVFGNSGLFSNNRFPAAANETLFHNLIHWILDQESLVNIEPRKLENYKISLSRQDLIDTGLRLLILPGGVALLGIMVTFIRRR